VADNGTGIPPEEIKYIWERFYKVDKSRARGAGAIFTVALPLQRCLKFKKWDKVSIPCPIF